VHRRSVRRDRPFVKVDCAALPASLMESGLFGHEKGSFTGAVKAHIGPFERADGGTIFLDEIGEIPLDLQAKLLRVVQDMEFERVGGEKTVRVDVRIIAATNLHLEKAVEEKRFRLDLFYRLNVIRIELPPLRERPEDIIPLAEFFLRHFSSKNQKDVRGIEEGGVQRLLQHAWPGNVRELENVIERAVVLTGGPMIPEDVIHVAPSQIAAPPENYNLPLRQIVADVESRAIRQALDKCSGSVDKAANLLGLNRTTLYSKLKKYRISA
jgi:transcriptional regulator with PAS, ATPase and Fis domain